VEESLKFGLTVTRYPQDVQSARSLDILNIYVL